MSGVSFISAPNVPYTTQPGSLIAVENALNILTLSDCGITLYVPQSTHAVVQGAANTIALPAPIQGFRTKIVFQSAGDNTAGHNWAITSTGANILGTQVAVAAGLVPVAIAASTNLLRSGTAANATANDWVSIECDGTNYHVFAFSSGAASPWSVS